MNMCYPSFRRTFLIVSLTLLITPALGCPFLKKKASVETLSERSRPASSHRRLQEYYHPPTEAPIGSCEKPPTASASPTSDPSTSPTSENTQDTSNQPTGEPSSMPSNEPSMLPPVSISSDAPTSPPLDQAQGLLPNPSCAIGPLTDISSEELCSTLTTIKEQFMALLIPADTAFQSRVFGASIRLCFHDAAEAMITDPNDRMGPDGCLQTVNDDNSGLVEPEEEVNAILEPIWQQNCNKISRADFWAFWGKLAVELSASSPVIVDYFTGRTDNTDCSAGVGRLPSSDVHDLDEIQRVLISQMGLTLEDAVTLLGAHSLGHVTEAFSGFGHPATDPDSSSVNFNAWDLTSWRLDNAYYRALLGAEWEVMSEKPEAMKAFSASPVMPLVMLNIDMALAYIVPLDEGGSIPFQQRCGRLNTCTRQPSTLDAVNAFATDDALFIQEFGKRFTKMCNVGYGYSLGSETFSGKLGTLTKTECGGI